jgi:hypothetical protein
MQANITEEANTARLLQQLRQKFPTNGRRNYKKRSLYSLKSLPNDVVSQGEKRKPQQMDFVMRQAEESKDNVNP